MITTFIPTYKRPATLKRAIESILSQTYQNFQLVVLDNASGDETETIVKSYMEKDGRVNYHCHSTNVGMLGNYKYAFSTIKTPYFHILSDDDYVSPSFFETAYADLQKYPDTAFCACGIEAINSNNETVSVAIANWSRSGYFPAGEGAIEMTSAHGKFPMPTGVLFRSELVSPFTPELNSDMQLMWDPDYLTRIAACNPIVVNPSKCGVFVAHDDGYSHAFYKKLHQTAEDFERFVIPCSKMIDHLNQCDIPPESSAIIKKNLEKYVTSIAKALSVKYIRNQNFDDVAILHAVTEKYYGEDFYLRNLARLASSAKKNRAVRLLTTALLYQVTILYKALKRLRR